MKFGVLVFPGSNRDHDAWHTINAVSYTHLLVRMRRHEGDDAGSAVGPVGVGAVTDDAVGREGSGGTGLGLSDQRKRQDTRKRQQ